jgi:Zn-dependent peptidase ImmA (M78 family)
MKKKKQFYIPGVYHNLTVKTVTKNWMKKRFRDQKDKENVTLGYYEHIEGEIYVARELTPEVKKHTVYHEISHHILDVLEAVADEETRCDLLGSYLMKLMEAKELIENNLLPENEQD